MTSKFVDSLNISCCRNEGKRLLFIIFYQNKINNILNEVDDSTQVTIEQVNSILNNLDTLLVNSATTVFGVNKQVCHQDLLVNHIY
jgi:hypothetical protein